MRLVVIGGGVAGLAGARAAAREAAERGLALDVTLVEGSDRLGGKIRTELVETAPIDLGPDSFLAAKPRGTDLAEELGLGGDLVTPAPAARRALLLEGGLLRPLPAGTVMGVPVRARALVEAVRAGVLSPLGAARVAMEPLLPTSPRSRGAGPTLEEASNARLGREATEALVAPLALGVFGAPASAVGFAEALPDAAASRSLILALRRRPRPSGSPFRSIRCGMGRLVSALVAELSLADVEVRTGWGAQDVRPAGDAFEIRGPSEPMRADAVLLAIPAPGAAHLLAAVAPPAAAALTPIRHAPSAVLAARFSAGTLAHPLDAAGFLVATGERLAVAACSFLSTKWPELGPGHWIRAVCVDPAALATSDAELWERLLAELARVLGARRDPDLVVTTRWPDALPVMEPGHHDRIRAAKAGLPGSIALAGALLGAVGIPDSARSGEEAAGALVRHLAGG